MSPLPPDGSAGRVRVGEPGRDGGVVARASGAVAALRAWTRHAIGRVRHGDRHVEAVFTGIHARNAWGDAESVSGRGSTLARTAVIRRELPPLLRRLGARSLLDAPCGDFNWMAAVPLGEVDYVGVDVVRALVDENARRHGAPSRRFLHRDLVRDPLPRADAVLCRDCLIHLPLASAVAAVANFRRSGAAYLLATTHDAVRENADVPTGGFRPLNLRRPPFDLPAPLEVIVEDAPAGKSLGVWRLREP